MVKYIVENALRLASKFLSVHRGKVKVLLRKQEEEERREASPMASEETKTPALPATSKIEAENATEIRSKLS